ncbi:MAG: hypothetical protein ACO3IW_13630, partial [Burkholderiales bacterium]
MKKLFTALIVLCGMSMIAIDVEARRLGGARNLGMQRNVQQAPKPPAQQQQAAGTQAQPQPAAAGNKWMGPLAGLAMGAGLMALFMNNGIAGVLAGLLLLAAIAGVAVLAFRALRGRAENAPLQYAGNQPGSAAPLSAGPAAHSLAAG